MTLNRRQTLAGLLGTGLGGAALAACAPKSSAIPYDGDAEIIILGAGLAGLRAAQILSDAGKTVLILEANDRVGGRVYTLRPEGGYAEAGGARIRAGDARLRTLVSDLGLSLFQDTTRFEDYAYWMDGKPANYAAWNASPQAGYRGPFVPTVSDQLVQGGAQSLPDAMAKTLPKPPILKTYIKALSVMDKEVLATDHTGRVWRGQKMICTLPFGALRHLQIKAEIAVEQKNAISRLPYVQNLQIHFRAKSRFWEKDGLPADMQTDGPIRHIIAARDASGRPTGLFTCTLYNGQIYPIYQNGAAGLHQEFRAELARLRPSTYAAIEIFEVVDWTSNNRAAGGAYSYPELNNAQTMGKPIGPLHFAGSHLGVSANGMEGALESAERTAAAILA